MNKWLVSISIAAAFAASPVYASVKNFEGFSAGVTINHAGSLFKVQRSYTSDYASRTEHSSSQDYGMSPGLQLQYRFPLGETFVLGVGGSFDSENSVDLKGLYGQSVKLKDTSSLFLSPGYAVGERWLVYAKLAGVNANLASGASTSEMKGPGFGAGFQYALADNWYLQAEFMTHHYREMQHSDSSGRLQRLSKAGFQSDVLTLGIGYRF